MPTKMAALREELILRLSEELRPLGFKLRKTAQMFYRKTPHGHEAIDLYFVAHQGKEFGVNFVIGVRFSAVEQIANEFTPNLPADRKSLTTTVGNRLDNIHGQPLQWTWYVSNRAELDEALGHIMNVVRNTILPYFVRFKALESVLEVLTPDGKEARKHCMWEPTQAKKALAAAFILGRREQFEEMSTRKITLIEEMAQHSPQIARSLPEVKALAEGLRQRWSEGDCDG